MRPFSPVVRNRHLLTIAGSLWPRSLEEKRFPVEAKLLPTEPDVRVLVHTQKPASNPLGELILVHGLEGSSAAGYMVSMAQYALEVGFAVHRLNLRNCGGTEFLAPGMYHGGLTADLEALLVDLDRQRRTPVFVVGFSLGGNIALKLAGELGSSGERLLAGVCAVSTPLDLAASVRQFSRGVNRFYEYRLLRSMKRRYETKSRVLPDLYPIGRLDDVRSVYEFDDRITAPCCGFQSADHYYETQSAIRYVEDIRVPTLLIQAQDDPLVPFEAFERPAVRDNPNIRLVAPEHGGHLGFLSRQPPLFWLDSEVVTWVLKTR